MCGGEDVGGVVVSVPVPDEDREKAIDWAERWYDRNAGPGETWTFADLIDALHDELGWAPRPVPSDATTMIEIGGQRMTTEQYDAARFPLLNPNPGPAPSGGNTELIAEAERRYPSDRLNDHETKHGGSLMHRRHEHGAFIAGTQFALEAVSDSGKVIDMPSRDHADLIARLRGYADRLDQMMATRMPNTRGSSDPRTPLQVAAQDYGKPTDNYTPTTKQVRNEYLRATHDARQALINTTPFAKHPFPDHGAEFDRWLTAHDAEVRAAALGDKGDTE